MCIYMYIIYTSAYRVVHQNAFSTTAGCGAMRGLGVVGAHVFLCKFRGKYPSAARNCRPRELGVVCLASPPRDLQENRGRSFKRPPPPPERYDSIHKCTVAVAASGRAAAQLVRKGRADAHHLTQRDWSFNFARLNIWAGVRKFKFRSKGGLGNMKS